MPDSAGEGFPNNVQVGHEHLHLSTGYIYQYLGGTPSNPVSWRIARGVNAACQIFTNRSIIPIDTNPLLLTYDGEGIVENMSWDGSGRILINIPGIYIMTHHGQLAATGLPAGQQRRASIYFRRNGIDISDSPVTNSVSGNPNDMRVLRNYRMQKLDAGDTISTYMIVEDATVGLGLYSVTISGIVSQSAKLSMSWIPI
jgi:hypothetical protein